ncbi:unnamed protein product [Fusarium graminearum]|nr:unnamed protein product [Fusarium graminearum]
MVDRNQCQTHTRTPWGTSEHRLDHRIRYALMVAFSIFFIVVDHSSENLTNLASAQDQVLIKTTHDNNVNEEVEPYHPPSQVCGAQLQDCQAFPRPDIYCPPLTVCHHTKTRISPSGIYCCAQSDECIVDEEHPAVCAVNTTQCGRDLGGGCCPDGTMCAPDGCLSIQTSLRKHSMPRAMITGLFHGDKTSDAVHTGIKFGEVGVVKSSACHAFLGPTLFAMPIAVSIMTWAIVR